MTPDNRKELQPMIEEMLSQLSYLRSDAGRLDIEDALRDYNEGYADGFAQCLGLLNDYLKNGDIAKDLKIKK